MTFSADRIVFVFFGPDSLSSVHCLSVSFYLVCSGIPKVHSWLWIDAKTRLYFCETSRNPRLTHPYDDVFVPLWENTAAILRTGFSVLNFLSICYVQRFLKCLPCPLLRALYVDGHPIAFRGFTYHFMRAHLIWSTNEIFNLAARTASCKLCHPIFYCCKRSCRLRSSIKL